MNEELENTQEAYDNEYNKAFFGEEEAEVTEVAEVETEEVVPEEDSNDPLEQAEEDVVEENTPTDTPLEEEPETEEAPEEEEVPIEEPRKFKLKWNGEEIEVNEDEMIALSQKGFDYTAKMQTVSKYRKGLEEAGIDDETIALIKGVKEGNKEALAMLAERNRIDPMDLIDVDLSKNEFNPLHNDTSNIVISEQVKPLMEQVMSNPSLQAKMSQAEDVLPNAVISRMAQDANMFHAVVNEIDSGSFDQVMPRINMKLATMSDLDREYALNSPEVFGSLYMQEKERLMTAPQAEPKVEAQQPQAKAKAKPNMAEVGVKKSNTAVRQQDVIKDAFTDDDEYQKILAKVRNQY